MVTPETKPTRYAIVGMKHRSAEAFVAALPADAPLYLVREPTNQYDRNAVQVWAVDGTTLRHVGYVPKSQNAVLAKFIDAHGSPSQIKFSIQTTKKPGAPAEVSGIGTFADSESPKYVNAKLHKGSNTYPLAEVG